MEEISVLDDKRSRTSCGFGFSISPAIERARAARPARPVAAPEMPQPSAPILPLEGSQRDLPEDISFFDYDGLRRALNEVRNARNISFGTLDEISGAPSGYFAKLLGPGAVKRIGLESLGWACLGLGIKFVAVTDDEALALVQSRYVRRDDPHLRSARARWSNRKAAPRSRSRKKTETRP